jgi:HSP20 family protein
MEATMASIVRYDPFATSIWSGRAVDSLFDRLFEGAFGRGSLSAEPATRRGLAANLFETEDGYVAEFPLPGVKPEDLEVTVRENTLTLHAKRNWQAPEHARAIWSGFTKAEWRHSFSLPGEVDAERVNATLEHGVLRLQLPKAEHARPRTIKVNTAVPAVEAQVVEAPAVEAKPAETTGESAAS